MQPASCGQSAKSCPSCSLNVRFSGHQEPSGSRRSKTGRSANVGADVCVAMSHRLLMLRRSDSADRPSRGPRLWCVTCRSQFFSAYAPSVDPGPRRDEAVRAVLPESTTSPRGATAHATEASTTLQRPFSRVPAASPAAGTEQTQDTRHALRERAVPHLSRRTTALRRFSYVLGCVVAMKLARRLANRSGWSSWG